MHGCKYVVCYRQVGLKGHITSIITYICMPIVILN